MTHMSTLPECASPEGAILYFSSRYCPVAAPARARTITRPLESAIITINITPNASFGILMVVNPFCHQPVVLTDLFQSTCINGRVSSRLARRRSSHPIAAYSFSCSRHVWHPPMCSAASRGIFSPSHNAEMYSPTCSQFILSPQRCLPRAKSFSTLPVLQRDAIAPSRQEYPGSRQAPRRIAPQLRAATKDFAALP